MLATINIKGQLCIFVGQRDNTNEQIMFWPFGAKKAELLSVVFRTQGLEVP